MIVGKNTGDTSAKHTVKEPLRLCHGNKSGAGIICLGLCAVGLIVGVSSKSSRIRVRDGVFAPDIRNFLSGILV
jgi:hypothetical protein